MVRRVFVLVVISIATSLGFGVVAASACYQPEIDVGGTYEAGDPVPYTVGGLEDGSTYQVSIDGAVVATGDSSQLSGSFPMPDLGSEDRSVAIVMHATHPEASSTHSGGGATYTDSRTVNYRAPAPPPAEGPANQPAAPPAEQPGATAPPAQEQPSGSPTEADAPSGSGGSGPPDRPNRPDRERDGAGGAGSAGESSTVTESNAATPRASVASTATTSGSFATSATAGITSAASSQAEPARAQPAGAPAARPEHREQPARSSVAVPLPAPVPGDGSIVRSDPIAVAAIVAVMLLLLGSGAALARRVDAWRRRPDDELAGIVALAAPHEVAHDAALRALVIEAELQELIAEHRARQADRAASSGADGRQPDVVEHRR